MQPSTLQKLPDFDDVVTQVYLNFLKFQNTARSLRPCKMSRIVAHHNSDGPNSNGSSFDSSPDEDDFNRERNWEYGLVFIFLLYSVFL